jgi:hypothetical protein
MVVDFQELVRAGMTRFGALHLLAKAYHVQSYLFFTATGDLVPPLLEHGSMHPASVLCVTIFWAERNRSSFFSDRLRARIVRVKRSTPWHDHMCCRRLCPFGEGCAIFETMKRPCTTAPTPASPASPTAGASGVSSHGAVDPAALAGLLQQLQHVELSYEDQLARHVDVTVLQITTLPNLRVVRICSLRAARLILARLLALWRLEDVVLDRNSRYELDVGVVYKLTREDGSRVFLWVGRHPSYYFNKPHSPQVREACLREIERTYRELDKVLDHVKELPTHH